MKKNDLTKLKEITKQIKIAKRSAVKVGLASDVGQYPDGTSVLEVGTSHEYGLGVPRRSFIRMPMEKEKAKLNKALKSGFQSILKGGNTIHNLNKIGLVAQNISKTSFKNQGYGMWEDISDATKAKKKSTKILFDTGRLVQSITFWLVKD